MELKRLFGRPIITPQTHASILNNINGPTVIRVPDWIERPLGRYYLYFAHHAGDHIRLAYADRLDGEWQVLEGGCLRLEQSLFVHHIASPEIVIDSENRQIVMYYHGALPNRGGQMTRAAVSTDGIHFAEQEELLGRFYWRVWRYKGYYYSIEMSGQVRRSRNAISGFEDGPVLLRGSTPRHMGLMLEGDILYIFYSCIGDCPEHIKVTAVDLRGDWTRWTYGAPESVLFPETDYEGGNLPDEVSVKGLSNGPVKQLRDPYVFRDDGEDYLFYTVAGESGIAVARIIP